MKKVARKISPNIKGCIVTFHIPALLVSTKNKGCDKTISKIFAAITIEPVITHAIEEIRVTLGNTERFNIKELPTR